MPILYVRMLGPREVAGVSLNHLDLSFRINSPQGLFAFDFVTL